MTAEVIKLLLKISHMEQLSKAFQVGVHICLEVRQRSFCSDSNTFFGLEGYENLGCEGIGRSVGIAKHFQLFQTLIFWGSCSTTSSPL